MHKFKSFVCFFLIACGGLMLAGCSTNPATGESQFTALMSPAQENNIGKTEHENIRKQFGFYEDPALLAYVRSVGARVVKNTERPDVSYQFFIIDSPIVNAFALPGGYIYVSRGLLALANSEAELAAVLAHEAGHITGRHSAERYSHGVLTSLGAAVLSAALDSSAASQALDVGNNLFLSSYSRGQESEADTLGLRYLSRAGYDVSAMASFLSSLERDTQIQAAMKDQKAMSYSYFSTHPATADRVQKTQAGASQYPRGGTVEQAAYLGHIDGMVFGDSEKQGFVRDQNFYHPGLGFTFHVPDGFIITNQPAQVIATSKTGAVIVFDMAAAKGVNDPGQYLQSVWMKNEPLTGFETLNIHGKRAATGAFSGRVNGNPVVIRLVVIEWRDGSFARFQMAIPQRAGTALVDDLKRTTHSFRAMTDGERATIKPYIIDVVSARQGESVSDMASVQPLQSQFKEPFFRVLNALGPSETLQAGQGYKVIKSQ